MFVAIDQNHKKINIEKANPGDKYFCQQCGGELFIRFCTKKRTHFAHKPKQKPCSDTWDKHYDKSIWHKDWQNEFPIENQEVTVPFGNVFHRGDVVTGTNVVEFQHSSIKGVTFEKRNKFYLNAGYKVIWLFDYIAHFDKNILTYKKSGNEIIVNWKKPNSDFNCYDVRSGNVDIFLQIKDCENDCIMKLNLLDSDLTEFRIEKLYNKNEFLRYIGFVDGYCEPPITYYDLNENYNAFKNDYKISVDIQEERAIQTLIGKELAITTPGVDPIELISLKLGYMILYKKIAPKDIAVIVYDSADIDLIECKYFECFNTALDKSCKIESIVNTGLNVCKEYTEYKNKKLKRLITEDEKKEIIFKIYNEIDRDNKLSERKCIIYTHAIKMLKCNRIPNDEILKNHYTLPYIKSIFIKYKTYMNDNKLMDNEDLISIALSVLNKDEQFYDYFSNKYKYVIAFELDNYSKAAFELIKQLSKDNYLCAIGNEDLGLEEKNGGYRNNIIKFKYEISNAMIIPLTLNHMINTNAMKIANGFINSSDQVMHKEICEHKNVSNDKVNVINVFSQNDQYDYIKKQLKDCKGTSAIIYRDFRSAILILDNFMDYDIPYNFVHSGDYVQYKDDIEMILSYLKFSIDFMDKVAFRALSKNLLFNNTDCERIIETSERENISILEALYVTDNLDISKYNLKVFYTCIMKIKDCDCVESLELIKEPTFGFLGYRKSNLKELIECLEALAQRHNRKEEFIKRVDELIKVFNKKENKNNTKFNILNYNGAVKQTFDNVYLVDSFDGILPQEYDSNYDDFRDYNEQRNEEYRKFYIGLTRSRKNLNIFRIKYKKTSFIDHILSNYNNYINTIDYGSLESSLSNNYNINNNRNNILYDDYDYYGIPDEIMIAFQSHQQDSPIRDMYQRRWIQCKICNMIKPESEFGEYGGFGEVNLGICYNCEHQKK